jgi:hypothetical protein
MRKGCICGAGRWIAWNDEALPLADARGLEAPTVREVDSASLDRAMPRCAQTLASSLGARCQTPCLLDHRTTR